MKGGMVIRSAHGGTHNLGVPDIDRSGKRDCGVSAQGRCSPQDRPDIPWILKGVENEEVQRCSASEEFE